MTPRSRRCSRRSCAPRRQAGLDPVTDGGLLASTTPSRRWLATSRLTDRAVKQVVTGPYTRGLDGSAIEPLNRVVRDLADAGCPLVEVHEPAATEIGADERPPRALSRRPAPRCSTA